MDYALPIGHIAKALRAGERETSPPDDPRHLPGHEVDPALVNSSLLALALSLVTIRGPYGVDKTAGRSRLTEPYGCVLNTRIEEPAEVLPTGVQRVEILTSSRASESAGMPLQATVKYSASNGSVDRSLGDWFLGGSGRLGALHGVLYPAFGACSRCLASSLGTIMTEDLLVPAWFRLSKGIDRPWPSGDPSRMVWMDRDILQEVTSQNCNLLSGCESRGGRL